MSNLSQFSPIMIRKFELFTSNGTWTFPTNIVKDSSGNAVVEITGIAGGGGGGRSVQTGSGNYAVGLGGCSGEYIIQQPTEVSGNISITIGAAGSATSNGTGQASGGQGGNTVIGSLTLEGGTQGAGDNALDDACLTINSQTYGDGIKNFAKPGTPVGDLGHQPIYPERPPGKFGGAGGMQFGTRSASEIYHLASGGAGGLVLDDSGKKANDGQYNSTFGYLYCGQGGAGYGAGGGGIGAGDGSTAAGRSGAGASGAVLIEWWEYA